MPPEDSHLFTAVYVQQSQTGNTPNVLKLGQEERRGTLTDSRSQQEGRLWLGAVPLCKKAGPETAHTSQLQFHKILENMTEFW